MYLRRQRKCLNRHWLREPRKTPPALIQARSTVLPPVCTANINHKASVLCHTSGASEVTACKRTARRWGWSLLISDNVMPDCNHVCNAPTSHLAVSKAEPAICHCTGFLDHSDDPRLCQWGVSLHCHKLRAAFPKSATYTHMQTLKNGTNDVRFHPAGILRRQHLLHQCQQIRTSLLPSHIPQGRREQRG
jgi:hypothetical protein